MRVFNNARLKGFMAQHAVTQKDLAKVLNVKPQAISIKIKKGNFRQMEMKKIIDFLVAYDEFVDMNIFA